ncbi:MAG: DUF1499 domain-containing protein [Sphingomonadales bacterium]
MTSETPVGEPVQSATKRSILAIAVFCLSVAALAAAALSGVGHARGWWSLDIAFDILRWSIRSALLAFVLSVIAVLRVRPGSSNLAFALVFTGLLVALGFTNYALNWRDIARGVPPIHDITTDLDNPPAFVDVVPLRENAPNTHIHQGAELAARQRDGYPDLGPLELSVRPSDAFALALDAARTLGWKIVALDEAEGRIEATDTTFWFGFKDDIVVRIAAHTGGAKIDVRSVSRVGVSDVGANARRITRFLELVERER